MQDLKQRAELCKLLAAKYSKRKRWLSVFLAILSSGSLGGWVIWRELALMWTTIIVISQVLTVVRPYVPYNKYVKKCRHHGADCEKLLKKMEGIFPIINTYNMESKEIEIEWIEHRRKYENSERYRFSSVEFPIDEKLNIKAEENSENYFNKYYS